MCGKATVFFAFLFLASLSVFSQKIVKKTLVNAKSKSFQIDATNCYEVKLKTSSTKEIVVGATIDGEYQKDLLVSIEEDGSNVLVNTEFQPNFSNPNDKLSAHKIISVALEISLPEYAKANVFGTHANVTVTGSYTTLQVNLSDGNCSLQQVLENTLVKTQKGTIYVTLESGFVDAKSNYGKVFRETVPVGSATFQLHSVEGDIHIKRTK